ncbi:MAG: tRNA 2-selenouridine(34) synthase MnmH [Bacteroidales bacterium]
MGLPLKNKTDIKRFLELAEKIPVIDVRSPSEFNAGHIPGAFNIPLFNDSEREAVGIRYKSKGRTKAILKGLELTGSGIRSKLEQALKVAHNGKLLVHCWRGGMRSEAMAWLFSLGDIETEVLEGGYKSYRRHILENLSAELKMIVLGGMTGSGKTRILKCIREAGHQVVDLEGIANHKGSAFGSLGQSPQPTTEYFANLLYDELKDIDRDRPLWIEDESRNIGNVFLPEEFYLNMQKNPAIVLMMDNRVRLPNLLSEYAQYPPDELQASIMKIRRRLGGDKAAEAIRSVESGEITRAIEIILAYYDKAYLFGLNRMQERELFYIKTDTDDVEVNALKVLDAAGKINW